MYVKTKLPTLFSLLSSQAVIPLSVNDIIEVAELIVLRLLKDDKLVSLVRK